jgi:hypothetical protein
MKRHTLPPRRRLRSISSVRTLLELPNVGPRWQALDFERRAWAKKSRHKKLVDSR